MTTSEVGAFIETKLETGFISFLLGYLFDSYDVGKLCVTIYHWS